MPKYDIYSEDPMEMIWAVREKIYEETKEMTSEEWQKYLLQSAMEVEAEIKKLKHYTKT